MTPTRLLIGLLLLATVLVDLVAWSALNSREPLGGSGGDFVFQAFWFLGVSQTSLLALWTGWATAAAFPWRLLVTAVFISGLGRIVEHVVISAESVEIPHKILVAAIGWSLITPAIAVLGFCLAARTAGLRLQPSSGPRIAGMDAAEPRRMQFSLSCLLSWLTVSAVLLGLFQHMEGHWLFASPLQCQNLGRIAAMGLCHAGLVVVAAVAAFGSGWKRHLGLWLVVVGIVAVHVGWTVFGRVGENALGRLLVLGWLLAFLGVFRVGGYRFSRCGGKVCAASLSWRSS
jgi:hypothetical protein